MFSKNQPQPRKIQPRIRTSQKWPPVDPIPTLESQDPAGSFPLVLHDKKSFTLWTQPGVSFAIADVLKYEPGWARVEDQRKANLLWVKSRDSVDWDSFDGSWQWVNRIYNESCIVTKGALAAIIDEYQKKGNYAVRVPTSHFLYTHAQCTDFQRLLKTRRNDYWIIKHTHLSQGRGASIHTSEDLLKKEVLDCDDLDADLTPGAAPEGRIVQEYILDPLLLDGYKSELRWYWVVTMDPFMVLLYPNATVRKTSQKYTLDDLSNVEIHLANTVVQKSANKEVDLAGLKWTLPILEEDLVRRGLTTPGWLERDLYPGVMHYLYDAIMAARPHIPPKPGTFVLFGADIMLDSKLGMWLLEVQTNPGMSQEGIKRWIIRPLLRHTANFVMEVDRRKRNGESLCTSDLKSLGLFLMIHNDADAYC